MFASTASCSGVLNGKFGGVSSSAVIACSLYFSSRFRFRISPFLSTFSRSTPKLYSMHFGRLDSSTKWSGKRQIYLRRYCFPQGESFSFPFPFFSFLMDYQRRISQILSVFFCFSPEFTETERKVLEISRFAHTDAFTSTPGTEKTSVFRKTSSEFVVVQFPVVCFHIRKSV